MSVVACFMSCEEDLQEYGNNDSLYFETVINQNSDYEVAPTEQASFSRNTTATTLVNEITVKVTGEARDVDRVFSIVEQPYTETDSLVGKAEGGRDYEALQSTYTIPAGETSIKINLTALKSEQVQDSILRVRFKLISDDFNQGPNSKAVLEYTIEEKFIKPDCWDFFVRYGNWGSSYYAKFHPEILRAFWFIIDETRYADDPRFRSFPCEGYFFGADLYGFLTVQMNSALIQYFEDNEIYDEFGVRILL